MPRSLEFAAESRVVLSVRIDRFESVWGEAAQLQPLSGYDLDLAAWPLFDPRAAEARRRSPRVPGRPSEDARSEPGVHRARGRQSGLAEQSVSRRFSFDPDRAWARRASPSQAEFESLDFGEALPLNAACDRLGPGLFLELESANSPGPWAQKSGLLWAFQTNPLSGGVRRAQKPQESARTFELNSTWRLDSASEFVGPAPQSRPQEPAGHRPSGTFELLEPFESGLSKPWPRRG